MSREFEWMPWMRMTELYSGFTGIGAASKNASAELSKATSCMARKLAASPVMANLEFHGAQRHIDLIECLLERRKKSVSFHLAENHAEIQVGAARKRLRIDFRTADDEEFALRM